MTDESPTLGGFLERVDLETPPEAYPSREDIHAELGTALGMLIAAEIIDDLDPRVVAYAPGPVGRIRNAVRALLGRGSYVIADAEAIDETTPEDLSETIDTLRDRVDALAAELQNRPSPEARLARIEAGVETFLADADQTPEQFLGQLEALADRGRESH